MRAFRLLLWEPFSSLEIFWCVDSYSWRLAICLCSSLPWWNQLHGWWTNLWSNVKRCWSDPSKTVSIIHLSPSSISSKKQKSGYVLWSFKFPLGWVPPRPRLRELAVQSLSRIRLFTTPWSAECQAPLSSAISQSLLKFMSIQPVTLSNHLIPCYPLLLLPLIFPSIGGWRN